MIDFEADHQSMGLESLFPKIDPYNMLNHLSLMIDQYARPIVKVCPKTIPNREKTSIFYIKL